MAVLTLVKDQTFENRRLDVDGGRFVRCRFIGSQLVYSATAEVSFEECSFADCEWVFDGAADRAMSYLSMLMRQGGVVGQSVVATAVEALGTDLFHTHADDVVSAAS